MKAKKNLIIVGDRVLIDPEEGADKTSSGLYLPPTVKEKEKAMAGYVVKTGPGYAVHEPGVSEDRGLKKRRKLNISRFRRPKVIMRFSSENPLSKLSLRAKNI